MRRGTNVRESTEERQERKKQRETTYAGGQAKTVGCERKGQAMCRDKMR